MVKDILIIGNDYFKSVPKNIRKINSGIITKSYSFDVNSKSYVIRFDNKRENFDKDLYAHNNFSSKKLHIPNIIKISKRGSFFYAISEKIEGKILESFLDNIQLESIDKVLDILFLIHETKLLKTLGYGDWYANGQSKFDSWEKYLQDIEYQVTKNEFICKDNSTRLFLDNLRKNYKYLPKSRSLIHGDFGFNNIMFNKGEVTGVIDWGDSKYGDFIYDVAYLIFWVSEIDYPTIFRKYYFKKEIEVNHFKQRVNCYLSHIGLQLLLYYESNKEFDNYSWVIKKLQKSFL